MRCKNCGKDIKWVRELHGYGGAWFHVQTDRIGCTTEAEPSGNPEKAKT